MTSTVVPAAPAGATTLMEVGEVTVYEVAAVVPNFTAVTPVKPLPVMRTEVPPSAVAWLGATAVMAAARRQRSSKTIAAEWPKL